MAEAEIQPPCAFLGDMCQFCSPCCRGCNPCKLLCKCICTCIAKCIKANKCCECDICPEWCPRAGDLVPPDEVTALDYINEMPKPKKKGWDRTSKTTTRARKFLYFLLGFLLVWLYGYVVIYHKQYHMWFCLITIIGLFFFACFGMIFSSKIRIVIFLMLPEIFSGKSNMNCHRPRGGVRHCHL